MNPTPTRVPPPSTVRFGREICGDLPAALRREWIATNGLGGYASGTLAGVNTRRYHGLLVAAFTPPVGRTVLVGGLVEWAGYNGRRYPLSTHEYADGTIDPLGYVHQASFRLEGMLPVWTCELADAVLERRVWMAHEANTTYVQYRFVRGSGPLGLEVTPLVTYRDFHTLRSGQGWRPAVAAAASSVEVRAGGDARPYRILMNTGEFVPGGTWYWNFRHREETARGLDDRSDLYAPGRFQAVLEPDQAVTLVATAETASPTDGAQALRHARDRQELLLRRAAADPDDAMLRQLVLAADQFIVRREEAAGTTVIAGYHWFNDWGRDTMIALPGLTLATGRAAEAAEILRAFGGFVRDGLLPNNFPDHSDAIPGYNTADASLWYPLAVAAYEEATGDTRLVDDLLPVLREILERHLASTRFGIGMDPTDGLLRAGAPGVQVTWMDAKVGDWVVTPRIGKPVEINALWYNALRTIAAWLAARGDPAADRYAGVARRAAASFRARFVRPDRRRLADVVDGPNGDDLSVRPNQIFAVSLPHPLLEGAEAAAVLLAVGRELLTTYGLRSLSPDDPAYRGAYTGAVAQRDAAYHQGAAWPWLIGPYVEAHYRVHGDRGAAMALLRPFQQHFTDAGLGTISEIFEGNPPHLPRGCIAQAWSVAEVLRVWRMLTSRKGKGR